MYINQLMNMYMKRGISPNLSQHADTLLLTEYKLHSIVW